MKRLVLASVMLTAIAASAFAAETPKQYHSPLNAYGYDAGYPDNYKPVAENPPAGPTVGQTWISYCSHKYKTYDPVSNTYWGADGKQYICKGE
jgi:hypothetical protein